MPFYGLSRRVHGVNNTLTACTVLSIYVRMSQRTCTILCKHSRLPQGLYCHHVCRCWKPNFAANDTRFIFLLRCYPSGEHGDKHCPCLKFVLFRVILNDPSASDKWHAFEMHGAVGDFVVHISSFCRSRWHHQIARGVTAWFDKYFTCTSKFS